VAGEACGTSSRRGTRSLTLVSHGERSATDPAAAVETGAADYHPWWVSPHKQVIGIMLFCDLKLAVLAPALALRHPAQSGWPLALPFLIPR
jgi:hypothetical protein